METAEAIVSDQALDSDQIREIFEKIDEVENVPGIDNMLPAYLRITKEEYVASITDSSKRSESIVKVDSAIRHLMNSA